MYGPEEGEPIVLYNGSAPTVSPDTWHNLKFSTEGTDPVTLTVYLNDSQIAQIDDHTYLVGEGKAQIFTFYNSTEPTLWADDYDVDDFDDNAIQTTSLGAIKTLFE